MTSERGALFCPLTFVTFWHNAIIFLIYFTIPHCNAEDPSDYRGVKGAQHDELESNLKKILHTNGIWGLKANVMYFHLPILKKLVSVAPALWEKSQNLAFESEIT